MGVLIFFIFEGHLQYLREAKKLGDILVVALNTDDSVRILKGDLRPINTLEDRANLVLALDCVDFVTSFSEQDPSRLIELLSPDILVKGDDYNIEQIVGANFVLQSGGQVKTLPLKKGLSSSKIIDKII